MIGPAAWLEVTERLEHDRILPVVTIEDVAQALPTANALARAGLGCIEVTLRTWAAFGAIRQIVDSDPSICVGAGTVTSVELARAAREAGAQFAVGPNLSEEVARECLRSGLTYFPGVATPTEIGHARDLGLTTMKLFPVSAIGGVGFIRAVASVYPDVRFIPTGGISPESVDSYLTQPSVLAVGGSWLTPPTLLRDQRFAEVEQLARETLTAISG
jgi:2-dehydro-3-deoxyphosphogluconate aldolase/(4S)-4-hydroxy-2-oxoglutarate aldolase